MAKPPTALDLAVDKAGSISELARLVGVKPQVANRWVHLGYVPPVKRARQIADLYGLPMRDLVKPDLRDLIDSPSFV